MEGVGLIDKRTHFGSSTAHIALTGAHTASSPYELESLGAWNFYRVWQFAPTAVNTYILLPDARLCDLGGPIFYMRNTHATNKVHIGAWGPGPFYPTSFATIKGTGVAAENEMMLVLEANAIGAGTWHALSMQASGLTLRGTS